MICRNNDRFEPDHVEHQYTSIAAQGCLRHCARLVHGDFVRFLFRCAHRICVRFALIFLFQAHKTRSGVRPTRPDQVSDPQDPTRCQARKPRPGVGPSQGQKVSIFSNFDFGESLFCYYDKGNCFCCS